MRVPTMIAMLVLAGCLQGTPDGAGAAEPAAPAWRDVRAAPDGFAGSEVSIAIDPNDPLHVVAVAHASGFGVYESFDGGRNWSAERLTASGLFGVGPVGTRLSLSDPVAAFSPDSTPHVAGLAYLPDSAVFVATRDGDGWTAHTVWQSEVAATFNDKEWLGINPETGTMVVAWQREPALDQLRGVEQAAGGAADVDAGLIVFSRSTDRGVTWSLPEEVGHGLHSNGTQVAFSQDGTGYMAWVDYEDPHLDVVVSRDDGQTWGERAVPSDVHIVGSYADFPRMHTLPGMAVDPIGDDLYIVWHDGRHGDADIMLAHSPDGAATWERHRVPDGPPGDGRVQFYPWVAVDGNGTAHVTYYGARDGTRDFAYRHVPFRPAAGFGNISDVSDTTFAIFDEGDGPASIGDYTAVAALGASVYPAWADAREDASFIHVGHLGRSGHDAS